MSDQEPPSLRELFTSALDLREQLDKLSSTSEEYRETVAGALTRLRKCRSLADSLALFSSNETFDDVATSDLPYLSTDYHIGDLITRQPPSDPTAPPSPSTRSVTLHTAQASYDAFLGRLDNYELLSKPERELYERFTDDPGHFALLGHADAARKREAKIARHRQEKDLEARLAQLRRDPAALRSDDGALRALRRAELSLNAHRAFQALDQVAQELAILALAPADPAVGNEGAENRDPRSMARANGDGYSERLDRPLAELARNGRAGPILSKEGKPLQPFTLLDSRQRQRDGVFRPGHNLPTMTIDEYLEVERQRGGIVDGGGKASGQARPVDEDDMEAADQETMKAREWDEFKEANPKGSGNTLNRG